MEELTCTACIGIDEYWRQWEKDNSLSLNVLCDCCRDYVEDKLADGERDGDR